MSGREVMAVVLLLGAASSAGAARLTVTASRADALYAPSANADCTSLSATADSALPFYVVRLHAEVPAGVDPSQARFQWQLPKPNVGVLAADEDLGPDGESSIIRTLCAEVGNACVLTEQQLAVYNLPTILWIAPTCDALPDDTTKPFRGGKTAIGVRAFAGKRRVGKGSVTVGWGRIGSATMLVANQGGERFRNGQGVAGGERIPLNPVFGAEADVPAGLPAIEKFEFDSNGGGTITRSPGCPYGLASCTMPGEVLYTDGGKHVASLAVDLADGSRLCDKLTVNVIRVPLRFTIDVTTTPARKAFAAGEGVGLRVRLRNTSPPSELAGILFTGQALSCSTEVRVGSSTLTKTAQIDLQHCSTTVNQPCASDADCRQPQCASCVDAETCITSSHCGSVEVGCVTDRDCSKPRCPECADGDICVQVLPLESIFLDRGDSFDVVNSTVVVDNALPTPARVKDEWTARSFNAGDESTRFEYTLKPKP